MDTKIKNSSEEMDRELIIRKFLSSGRFEDAEDFALTVEPDWERAESLSYIARAAWKLNDVERARRLWSAAASSAKHGENSESPQDSFDASSVIWEIAENLAAIGAYEEAREMANSIQNEGKREHAVTNVEQMANGSAGAFEF